MKEILFEGGTLVYIIIFFSILGLAVVIERLIYFFYIEKGDYEELKKEVFDCLKKDDIPGAQRVCEMYDNSVSRVLNAILENPKLERKILEEKVKEVALSQIPILERFVWLLGITANVSPLLGLLGTVTGMIKAFNVIAIEGVGKPEMLASGISEALITTAAGLTVAIPAMILNNYINKKIDNIINEMEKASVETINILEGE